MQTTTHQPRHQLTTPNNRHAHAQCTSIGRIIHSHACIHASMYVCVHAYRTALHRTATFSTVLHCTALQLRCTELYCTVLHWTALDCACILPCLVLSWIRYGLSQATFEVSKCHSFCSTRRKHLLLQLPIFCTHRRPTSVCARTTSRIHFRMPTRDFLGGTRDSTVWRALLHGRLPFSFRWHDRTSTKNSNSPHNSSNSAESLENRCCCRHVQPERNRERDIVHGKYQAETRRDGRVHDDLEDFYSHCYGDVYMNIYEGSSAQV